MAHEIAKILLEQVGTQWERERAVVLAMQLGMPLHEIEEYLDWIALLRRDDRLPPTSDAGGDLPPDEVD